MKVSEADIQRQIIDYLKARCHFVFRVNTQGVPLHRPGQEGRFRPSPMKGVADLIGCMGRSVRGRTAGTFFAIEVKSKTGSTTPEQRQFLQDVQRAGGIALVARSVDEVIAAGL